MRRKRKKCPQSGKLCYSTEAEARDQLWKINFWNWSWHKENRYYFCANCRCYHLTSKGNGGQENDQKTHE